jgi:hypothetical protein
MWQIHFLSEVVCGGFRRNSYCNVTWGTNYEYKLQLSLGQVLESYNSRITNLFLYYTTTEFKFTAVSVDECNM